MGISNPDTLAKLRELGCITRNDRINRSALAKLFAADLEQHHIAGSLEHVTAVQTTVGQLATRLLGVEDPEFVDDVKPMFSPGAGGIVQLALTNGYLLCAGKTEVEVSIEGEVSTKTIGTRFLSADPAVIQKHVLDQRLARVESMAQSTVQLRELVGQRRPDMEPQLETFTEKLNVTWRTALGTGDAA